MGLSFLEEEIYRKYLEEADNPGKDIDFTGVFAADELFSRETEHLRKLHSEIDEKAELLSDLKNNTTIKKLKSRRGITGAVIIFVKRLIRKAIVWYAEPSFQQQTDYNNTVSDIIDSLKSANRDLAKAMTGVYAKQLELENRLKMLESGGNSDCRGNASSGNGRQPPAQAQEKARSDEQSRRKIALAVQRYGREVNGGSEYYAMQCALRLNNIYDVDVLTSTSKDHATWDEHYDDGDGIVDGVKVKRFKTEQSRNLYQFEKIAYKQRKMLEKDIPTLVENDHDFMITQGPYCPDMLRYIYDNYDNYDAFIFFTYLYYPAVYGLPLANKKAIFIPTAHDEIWIRQSIFKAVFQIPKYILFLTDEEKEFVHGYFGNAGIKSDVIGTGIDIPEKVYPEKFRETYSVDGEYMIFVGRVEVAKGCDIMISHFAAYKESRKHSDLKLVIIGGVNMDIPGRDDIIITGFVDEQTKYDGIAGASLIIAPSEHESLCISLLEGFAFGIPALVNGNCRILRAHCEKSGAGLPYTNEQEFIEGTDKLMAGRNDDMSNKATAYVCGNYTWEKTISKFRNAIEWVGSSN